MPAVISSPAVLLPTIIVNQEARAAATMPRTTPTRMNSRKKKMILLNIFARF